MKIKVFNPGPKEKVLTLALRETASGVKLSVVDPETGEIKDYGNLLLISKEGQFTLCENISYAFGLHLDASGRLVVHYL